VTQLIIDVHAHFVPKCLFERFDANAKQLPSVKLMRDDKGVRMQFPGTEPTRPVSPKLSDLADRRAWMDKNGIDHQLVGGWLDIFGYELPAQEGLAWRPGAASSTTACGTRCATSRGSRRSRPYRFRMARWQLKC